MNPFESEHGKVISTWSRLSSNGYTKYTTLLYKDGFMSCNCPGWCIQKTDDNGDFLPRVCKHTKDVDYQAGLIKKGMAKPVWGDDDVVPYSKPVDKKQKQPKFEGRRIEMGDGD